MERLGALAARVMQAQAQLATQWGQVVGNALRDLGQKLAPQLQGGALPASLREVYDLWVDTAEKAYAGTAQGSAFTQAQSELANALSQLRIAQRDWLEEWGRAFDLPTRAELNSLHQQVRAAQGSRTETHGQGVTADDRRPWQDLADLQRKLAASLGPLRAAAGVQYGCSEKDAVHRDDKLVLYRYRERAPRLDLPPLLIVYALVNRPYMMDLQPDRSLIRRLLELGHRRLPDRLGLPRRRRPLRRPGRLHQRLPAPRRAPHPGLARGCRR